MTPQEQYPKFYSHPHYWINAIEVECVQAHKCVYDDDTAHVQVGNRFRLALVTVEELVLTDSLKYYVPKFKPQEGEAFIKDLEEVVSAATGMLNVKHCGYDAVSEVFDVNDGEYLVEVFDVTFAICTSDNLMFDTAAYVDKLRELGYYI